MKRSLYILILTFILTFSYTLCAGASDYDTIKVGLYYGSTAQSSVSISSPSGVSYGYFDGSTHVETGILYGTDFTVSALSETALLINGVQAVETGGTNLSIKPVDGNIKINGKEYRGSAMFLNASSSSMTVINVLPLEEYLYGVIASEMPSSWNVEALKAQAICARGFAVSNFNKHSSYGFNVCTTTNCQVYGGVSSEKASVIEAVDHTRGEVITYDGKVIESLFYSSSGGYTANVKNVWGSSIPYLCGVEDPYEPKDSPRHTWSATLSNDEIANILKESGYDIGSLVSLDAKVDETGRAYELTAKGTNGSHTYARQGTYSSFYSSGVLSQKYTLSPVTTGGRTLYAIDSNSKGALSSMVAMDYKGSKVNVGDGFTIISGNGKEIYTPGTVTGYTFNGGGWGHGVGMSQYGAKGMADAGFTYDKIVAHYYPGTELKKMYE